MNIEQEYEELYSHWVKEFNHLALTELSQDLFDHYNEIVEFIKNYTLNSNGVIENQIIKFNCRCF